MIYGQRSKQHGIRRVERKVLRDELVHAALARKGEGLKVLKRTETWYKGDVFVQSLIRPRTIGYVRLVEE